MVLDPVPVVLYPVLVGWDGVRSRPLWAGMALDPVPVGWYGVRSCACGLVWC
jgi:hypothetical protein